MGLCDLQGNAWKGTRSPYRPGVRGDGAPASETGEFRTVRAGSWRDRPQRATATARLGYPAWQRVFNVGFRVVCEDAPMPFSAGGQSGGTASRRATREVAHSR
ncbi:MAG: SUMF1/EgtB/PvdO family nonheme iron enzyme [Verrucomicrobia bacterium]|nr:SUMF1/EgtB/PvdO family nonheme iron enzyme [Verrucomicrobiota bacterium]